MGFTLYSSTLWDHPMYSECTEVIDDRLVRSLLTGTGCRSKRRISADHARRSYGNRAVVVS